MEQGQHRAAVIEVFDRDGHVRSVHKISQWPVRIGRSPACDVVLDDLHLAGEHAQLDWVEDGATLQLLPSLNGGWLGPRRLSGGEVAALSAEDRFQLGDTQLRWRSTAAALAPELPMARHQQHVSETRAFWVPALLLVWLGLLWFEQWTSLNPGSPWIDYASAVLAPLAVVLGWAALWSLVTQLFRRRFPFMAHLRRALVGLTGLQIIGALLPLTAFAFSLPRLLALDALVSAVGMTALLWWHASLVWPRGRRSLALGLAALLLLGGVLSVAKRQHEQRWFGPAYMSQLPPPAFRLVAPKPPEALIDSLRPLEAELAKQASRDNDDAGSDGDD